MDYLEITLIGEGSDFKTTDYITTSSPVAYKYFIRGMEALWTGHGSVADFRRALEIDSTFTNVYFFGSIFFFSNDVFYRAKENLLLAYEGKDQLPEKMQLWLEALLAFQQILKLNKKFGPWRNQLFY
jgi:hypothetical protein